MKILSTMVVNEIYDFVDLVCSHSHIICFSFWHYLLLFFFIIYFQVDLSIWKFSLGCNLINRFSLPVGVMHVL